MSILQLAFIFLSLWGSEERSGFRYHQAMNFDNSVMEDTSLILDATNYRLIFDLDIPAESLTAEAEISLTTIEPLDSIRLHFVGLEISSVEVGGTPRSFVREDSFLVVSLGSTVAAGTDLILKIGYHGSPTLASEGFGKGMYINSGQNAVTYTCNAPWGAKYWFPCQDNPADKASMEMIVTVPAGYEVISNGRLDSADRTGDYWTFHLMESHPIATYLIAFAASANYALTEDTATIKGSPLPLYHWVLKPDSADITPRLMVVKEIIEYFSGFFYPYPFADEKYSHVAVPIPGGMENQTCTHINTGINWGDWDFIVAHELSHSWWGDATTCRDLKHMWLNEGFATYCEALWAEHRDGAQAYQAYISEGIIPTYIAAKGVHDDAILDFPWSQIYSPLTYEKGAAVLHMLRRIVGDEDFFVILQTYGLRYQDSTALSEDFEAVVAEVTGEDYSWFFDQWLREAGHPKYLASWDAEELGDSTAVTLKLRQTQTWPPDAIVFTMPVEFGLIDGSDTSFVSFTDSLAYQEFVLLRASTPAEVVFDPHDNLLCEHDLSSIAESRESTPNFSCSALTLGHLQYSTGMQEPLSLTLYDVSGREVQSWQDLAPQGYLDITYLPAGVYFISIMGEETTARRVVLIK